MVGLCTRLSTVGVADTYQHTVRGLKLDFVDPLTPYEMYGLIEYQIKYLHAITWKQYKGYSLTHSLSTIR